MSSQNRKPLQQGVVLEWLKRHAWKACIRQKRIPSSNLGHSAEIQNPASRTACGILCIDRLLMCDSKECIALLSKNLPYIQKEFRVSGLCIFSSMARGDNRENSDVDILVDMPPEIFLMSALKRFLEGLLNTSVDLVRRHSHLSKKFLDQISSDAITLL